MRQLAPALAALLRDGIVLPHGRLQSIDASGCVVSDASEAAIPPKWVAPLQAVLHEWQQLPGLHPGIQLLAVYARGSLPRGLALDGVSDVDTLGFVTFSADFLEDRAAEGTEAAAEDDADCKTEPEKGACSSSAGDFSASAALVAWQRSRTHIDADLRRRFPFVSKFEMSLIAAPRHSFLGRWLHDAGSSSSQRQAAATNQQLSDAQLVAIDGFRLRTQAVKLLGAELHTALPARSAEVMLRLALSLPADLRRAAAAVRVAGAFEAEALGKWALKRTLRSGMEAVAKTHGGFSRDLLPCHQAISAQLPTQTAEHSLRALQLACLPPAADGEEARRNAAVMIAAAFALAEALEPAFLSPPHFTPLASYEQMAPTPPLASLTSPPHDAQPNAPTGGGGGVSLAQTASTFVVKAVAAVAAATSGSSVSGHSSNAATAVARPAVAAGGLWRSMTPLASRLRVDVDGGEVRVDGLRPLQLSVLRPVTAVDWALDADGTVAPPSSWWRPGSVAATQSGQSSTRVSRIARRWLGARRRPLVLRSAAAELLPVGSALWNARTLPLLVRDGRVRISDSPTFVFCKEGHPLVRSRLFPPPSVTATLSADEFVRRLRLPRGSERGLPPIRYAAGSERYYMQTDVPPSLLRADKVPELWRLVGAEQAQPLRLWVSAGGSVTPLHFDSAHSFLAQLRGQKRITFFPPNALPGLYPYPMDHPLARRSRVDLCLPPSRRRERYPSFERIAEPLAQQVVLNEGDALFFPAHWWHHVETLTPIAFSITCRYTT